MGTIGYGYGSEWQLLHYLGRRRDALTSAVHDATGVSALKWLDGEVVLEGGALKVREHKGLRFMPASDPARTAWEAIWPQSGNAHNWDAVGLGRAGGSQSWVLVEAKAHLGEMNSSCAASDASRSAIKGILEKTRQALKVTSGGDWTEVYYQAANRIALLHFLLERGLDVRLVFLYFTGDRTDLGAPGRACPSDDAGWAPALAAAERPPGGAPRGANPPADSFAVPPGPSRQSRQSLTHTISISTSQLNAALTRVAPGLEKYCWIQDQLLTRNVATDRDFQKRFAGFYRVRRNGDWRAAFFGILEDAKTSPISFAEALQLLRDATGQVEASFASKLVATVNPELPVIDSVVVGNLGLKVAKANDANRMGKLVELHQSLATAFAAYLSSEDGRRLVRTFKGQYPTRKVSELKMLDLVLWQIRG